MKVLFLGSCADWADCTGIDIQVTGKRKVSELLENRPELKALLRHRRTLKVAVNHEMASLATSVGNGDEVAFMSPFGGG